jgi:U3 small nucleolar RNA-associated protein 14
MSSDEEEVNPVSHKKLLSEINDIVKFQHVKKPKRSEPSIKISEFHLVKSKADDDGEEVRQDKKNVSIKSVANIVRKNESQKKIGNQLQATFKKDKVLKRPLEKIHADRVQRAVAYDNTRNKLSRWDAIVTKNKNAEQLYFPLSQEKVRFTMNKEEPALAQFRYKTQMMKEIEEINNECFPKAQTEEKDEISNELLTLDEMKERRREIARLKLKESQKIAKKRLQGKIKSKKYHRLRKREELKQKLKDFEELKVSNPEAALKELEKIEKQRIQERANLRHKNTGTWAKNMKVIFKYF